jgi:hypothetical protein
MSKLLAFVFKVLDIIVIFTMTFGSPMSALAAPAYQETPPAPVPTITSDLPDYAPGAQVTLTGANWQDDTQVRILVNDSIGDTWVRDVVVDVSPEGGITDIFNLPSWFVANYLVYASGLQTGRVATAAFTDEELSWDQCQNDTDPNDNAQDPCYWTNGALNTNNSIYAEGDVVPQRHIRGVSSAGAHYTKFDHSFYDQAKDAYTYDFWATTDFTLGDDLNACNDLASSLGLSEAQCKLLFNAKQSVPIPSEATYTIGGTTYTYPFVAGAEAKAAADGVTRNLWISCGTIGGTKQNPTFTTGTCSNVGITILGHGDSNKDLLPTSQQQGVPDSEEFVQMRVDYTTPANTYVAIWVGGHLAKSSYWNEPETITNSAFLGYGSSYASGASFHQRLIGWDLNSAIGNRDNQIQNSGGTIVLPGSITIVKDDTSDSGTPFDFTASFPLLPAAFSLSDDGVNSNGENKQVFTDLHTAQYTITETADPNWDLTKIACTKETFPYAYSVYSGSGVTIDLQPGDNVTCTFTNSPIGGLEVSKTANTSLTRTYDWTIDKKDNGEYWKFIGDPASVHPYTVSVDKTFEDSKWAVDGVITIKNTAPVAATITGVADVISDGINAVVSCPVTFPTPLAAGATLTCTYTASLPNADPRTNTATVTTSGVVAGGSATAPVSFAKPTITEAGPLSINVTDTNGQAWGPVNDDASWTYNQEFSCPTDPSLYANGVYEPEPLVNTATITENGKWDTATVQLHCYAPVVSKIAAGLYDRSYTWSITKGPDGEYSRFAGESATHNYTVTVDQTISDSPYVVAGAITVKNPNPKAPMTVNLADSVAGVPASLACGGSLTIPAGGSNTCNYSAAVAAPTPGTNTATASLNSFNFPASADYTFTEKTYGLPTIGVTDTNGKTWTASGDASWEYDETFTCSSDPKMYAGDGTYDIKHVNTASIDDMDGKSDNATVIVHCYAPVLSKTATAGYDERHTWDITKDVTPHTQNGFAGDTLSWTWIVGLSEGFVNENFAVTGVITVVNPAPMPMTVSLADMLNDATAAAIAADDDCALVDGQLTIPAGGTATCGYAAAPTSMTATKNTATATLNKIAFSAEAAVSFVKNVVNGTATVKDTQIGLNQTVEAGGTYGPWTKTYDHTCSAKFADYGPDGMYTGDAFNTATVTASNGQTDSASAATAFNCYAPIISKTAAGTYDERHEWDVVKTVDPASQSGFAGDVLSYNWKIMVTESVTEENFKVAGTITVKNPAPMSMTVTLTDVLDVIANVIITPDNDCAYNNGQLTIPMGATATCGYTSTPGGRLATKNTATATLNKIAFNAETTVGWTVKVIRGNANLVDDELDLNILLADGYEKTFTETYTCSTDTTKYTENYSYSEKLTNTARIISEGFEKASETETTVTCYIPEISKTAAGTYGERHEWDVTKTVAPVSQNAFAGQTVSYEWTVVVTEQTFEENFVVDGTITVTNHNPEDALTVALSDVVDGVPATIESCTGDTDLTNGLTIAAGGTSTCKYIVGLEELSNRMDAPTTNTATAVLNGQPYTATDPIEWTATITRDSATIDDDQNPGFPLLLTEDGIFTYSEEYTCSSDTSAYIGDGFYSFGEDNTATLKSGNFTDSSTVSTTVNCYAPVISKTAAGTYDERHEWTIKKTVDPASQSGFAGDSLPFTWTIVVSESVFEENFDVAGTITVQNPAPMAMTVALSDVLSDATNAVIGACTKSATYDAGSLTIPAETTTVCEYAANDLAYADNAIAPTDNTATATLNGIAFPATAPINYMANIIRGEAEVLDPDLAFNETLIAHHQAGIYVFGPYDLPDSYVCKGIDEVAYDKDYRYYEVVTNTATVTSETWKDDSESSTTFYCYVPEISKTAAGAYDERHEWEVEKTVTPGAQSGFAGENIPFTWTVTATESVFEENFVASGTITVKNHNPEDALTVALSDVLSDGKSATITSCTGDTNLADGLTIPADGTSTCEYTAELIYADVAKAPTNNTATAVLNGKSYSASDPVEWTANVIRGEALVSDDQGLLSETITGDKSWEIPDSHTCSTDVTKYTDNYSYTETIWNTAKVKSGYEKTSTTSTTVTCYIPEISKTASGTYGERHEWDVEKTVTPAYQTGFAGDTLPYEWKVVVTEQVFEESFVASGKITVVNHNPEDAMTVALSDILSDNTAATITGCTGDTDLSDGLTIAAGDSSVCDYTASLSYNAVSNAPTNNTATAVLNGISYSASDPIEWAATVTRGSATVTDDQIGLNQTISDGETFTGADKYTCSTDTKSYSSDGTYSFSEDNTAIVTSGGAEEDRDSATEKIDCYAPVVSKTATTYWNRDWDWTITKGFDHTYNLFAGEKVIHDYKVTVTPNKTDNFWGVKGTITVVNNHPTADMVLTSVSDLAGDIDGAVSCPSLTVPADGSLTCTYNTGPQNKPDVNPFGPLNTATAVFAGANWTGTAPIIFSDQPTTEDEPVIAIDDNNLTGENWSADRAYAEWTYTKEFACSTSPSAYTNGKYSYSLINTAMIKETGQTDTATVDVNCYAPVVSKTAAGTYDERHEWKIEKTVKPAIQNIFAGDTASFDWTVVVGESVFEEKFLVTGNITVVNPAPMPMTVDVSDVLKGGTVGVVQTCQGGVYTAGKLVIPANSTATCAYSASPLGRSDDLNTVTAIMNGITFSAEKAFGWTPNIIRPTATIDDDLYGAFPQTISDGATFDYSTDYTCSTNTADYTDGYYQKVIPNTATFVSGEKSGSSKASTIVNCYAPVVSKTAAGTYDERHEWDIEKTVDPASQDVFAGLTAAIKWTVTVLESVFEENFDVTGTITVKNPAPMALTVAMSDELSDGTKVAIGTCTNGATYLNGSLTIPAGTTTVCGYTANDLAYTDDAAAPKQNTVTVTYGKLTATASDIIEWAPNVIRAKANVDDTLYDKFPLEITDGGTWTYSTDYTCSTNPDDYTNGTYKKTITNTAIVTSGSERDRDTASSIINCYAPVVSKTAAGTYDERHEWDVEKTVSPASQDVLAGLTAPFNWIVTVAESVFEENFDVAGTITVKNPAPMPVTVTVADQLSDGTAVALGSCTNGATYNAGSLTIPANTTTVCSYSANDLPYTDDAAAPLKNTATVTLNGLVTSAEASIAYTVKYIRATATLDDTLYDKFPQTITDGGTWKYSTSYTCSTNIADYTNGKYTYSTQNTAIVTSGNERDRDTASAVVNCYAPLVEKSAFGTYDERHDWKVTKSVDPASQDVFATATANFNWLVKVTETVVEENFVVAGVIKVTNPAPLSMTVDLTDILGDNTVVDITSGLSCNYANGKLTIPANTTSACEYSAKLPYADDAKAAKTNMGEVKLNGLVTSSTASIVWKANIIRPEATLTDEQKPLSELLKSEGPFPGSFEYVFPYADSYTCSGDVSKYDATGRYQQTIYNTAKVVSGDKSDSSTASTLVKCYIPTISKTATPAFTREFFWKIVKDVDKNLVRQVGGSATFNYTVVVSETGHTDRAWLVTGKVTLTNPNPAAPITVNVTDVVDNGGVCTVNGALNVVVGAGQTTQFDYTCSFAEKPTSYAGINTVTAEWKSQFTDSQFVSNTAAFKFDTGLPGNPVNINKTVNVNDTFNITTVTPLGSVTATLDEPYTTRTFTYPRVVPIPSFACKSYDNTARIIETGQNDSERVTVCGPVYTNAKTMGFWQNKNGQDIIKKAGVLPGTSICKLTPRLRQYAPFQDLSASSSCTTVATYVYNKIKLANASGASMNAMLKGQMLATALDVYFSDPALGGNKLGSPVPIGSITVDLTLVKGYQNVGAAFGGATHLTVSDMLAYAASNSNGGGSTWYANVKATQELAKNAFDAINNQWILLWP